MRMIKPREITDSFRLDRVLKSGRSGIVFKASNLATGEEVALKLIAPGCPAELHICQEQFLEAMEVLQQVAPPGFPTLKEYGFTPDGTAFMVMELLDAAPLEPAPAVPARTVLALVAGAVAGLEGLAAKGVAHGNLTPSNLLCRRTPEGEQVALVGFGTAAFRIFMGELSPALQAGEALDYAAPELTDPAGAMPRPDWRSDLYSLARVTCHLLKASIAELPGLPSRVQLPAEASAGLARAELLGAALEQALRREPQARQGSWSSFRVALLEAIGEAGATDAAAGVPGEVERADAGLAESAAVFEPVVQATAEDAPIGGTMALPLRDLLPGTSLPPQVVPVSQAAPVTTPPPPPAVPPPPAAVPAPPVIPISVESTLAVPVHRLMELPERPAEPEASEGMEDLWPEEQGAQAEPSYPPVEVTADAPGEPAVEPLTRDEGPAFLYDTAKGKALQAVVPQPVAADLAGAAPPRTPATAADARPDPPAAEAGSADAQPASAHGTVPAAPAEAFWEVSAASAPPQPPEELAGAQSGPAELPAVPPPLTLAEPVLDPVLEPVAAAPAAPAPAPKPAAKAAKAHKRTLWPLWLLLLLVILGGGALGVLWYQSKQAEEAVRNRPTPTPVAVEPTAAPVRLEPTKVVEALNAAADAVAAQDLRVAQEALDLITPVDEVQLSEANKQRLAEVRAAAAELRTRVFGTELSKYLAAGNLKALGRLIGSISREEEAKLRQDPDKSQALDEARRALNIQKLLLAADKAGNSPETLQQAQTLLAVVPGNSQAAELRDKAAVALESQAQAAAERGEYDQALERLDGLGRIWPARPGLPAKVERVKAEREADRKLAAVFATAEQTEQAKTPEKGLQILADTRFTARWEARVRALKERLGAQLATIDAQPPKVEAAKGTKVDMQKDRTGVLELDKDKTWTIPLQVSDDHGIKSVKCMVRPQGSASFVEQKVTKGSGGGYTAEVGPGVHKNEPVQFYVLASDFSDHVTSLGSPEKPWVLKKKKFLGIF